jgi:hypothetical protein
MARKAGTMTTRRKQVLAELQTAAEQGQRISLARLARRCGLYDYRDARRIVGDINRHRLN